MHTNEERRKLIVKANTEANTRLRHEFHKEFRAMYFEELEKLGVSIRRSRADKRVEEMKEEIKRLQNLLAEQGVVE